MITLRKSNERGHADHGWLKTFYTFSFSNYYDPKHMGYASLRVINDDVVAPGQGFGTHGHKDMEILTWVLDGQLEHKDSMGNRGVIKPGELQRMSAGTGVRHSEFNASQTDPVHLLQIWIEPEREGIEPGYEQTTFPAEGRDGKLQLLAAKNPNGPGAVTIHQDASLRVAELRKGQSIIHPLANGRSAWVHVAYGDVDVNGNRLSAGDAIALENETSVSLAGVNEENAQVLLFDLA